MCVLSALTNNGTVSMRLIAIGNAFHNRGPTTLNERSPKLTSFVRGTSNRCCCEEFNTLIIDPEWNRIVTDDSLQEHEVRREEENVGKNLWRWRRLGGEGREERIGGDVQHRRTGTKPGFCGDGSGNRPHIKVEKMRIKNS